MLQSEYIADKLTTNTGVEWRAINCDELRASYLISADRKVYSIGRHKVMATRKFGKCLSEYIELSCELKKKLYQIDELMIITFPELYTDESSVEWKTIKINGEKSAYEVSNEGTVRRVNNRHIVKPLQNSEGYLIIRLRHKGTTFTKYLHRIVAMEFVPNPCGYNIVNHKDENRLNDNADNLEWCDRSYNFNYSYNRRKAVI